MFLGRVEDSDWVGDSKHSCCRCKTQDCVLDDISLAGNVVSEKQLPFVCFFKMYFFEPPSIES